MADRVGAEGDKNNNTAQSRMGSPAALVTRIVRSRARRLATTWAGVRRAPEADVPRVLRQYAPVLNPARRRRCCPAFPLAHPVISQGPLFPVRSRSAIRWRFPTAGLIDASLVRAIAAWNLPFVPRNAAVILEHLFVDEAAVALVCLFGNLISSGQVWSKKI